jgi:RNA polymerase sigma-70 factor (ECF subfamily)
MLPTQMDADRFVELYEETLDDVYRYASRLTGGDRVRTDELVQETYLGVMRRLGSETATSVEPTRAYLIVACRNRFLDQLRSERRRRRREQRAATTDRAIDPIDTTDLDGGRATTALGSLSDARRAALVLRYVDDLTVAQVADELGRSLSATESLLARARNELRAALDDGRTS